MLKKLYIKTYGCQMNNYDSDRMQDIMHAVGYEVNSEIKDSDMVIINTCHIREKATEKLFSDLGRVRKFKDEMRNRGKKMIVAVAGCVAQAEGNEIFKRSDVVDIIVGPESYQTLPDLVGKVIRNKSKEMNLDFHPNNKFDSLMQNLNISKKNSASAFVTIQEGCDKFCTFCVVPYTRGAEYSRDVSKILDEIKLFVASGVKEIYLLGQNVNAFHGNDNGNNSSLAKLIEKIALIDEVKRIRYTTSHPNDMSNDLIEVHRDINKLMPFLHLPIQSGSNNILKAMNRKHTRQDYFKVIEKLRNARNDIALSSDFIVGFPGETDKDFMETIDLVNKIGYSQCYSFKYSPRIGTPSADSLNQIPEDVKDARLAELQKLLSQQQISFNNSFEGKILPVLFEKEAPKSQKKSHISNKIQLWGKSPYLQSVVVEIDDLKNIDKYHNNIFNVKIIKARPSSLIGEIVI